MLLTCPEGLSSSPLPIEKVMVKTRKKRKKKKKKKVNLMDTYPCQVKKARSPEVLSGALTTLV